MYNIYILYIYVYIYYVNIFIYDICSRIYTVQKIKKANTRLTFVI